MRKELEIILGGFRWRFRKFGAISRTCQNRPCSKPWAIAQAFCSKSANFRPLRIQRKSTQTVAQGVRNHFRRVYEAFQRVWSDYQDLQKSAMFKQWAIVQAFSQKRPNFDPCEFIRNRHKQLRKELEIILGGFSRRFREFGAISSTWKNRPCSKPWVIAQAFCSKTAKFRLLRIQRKSTQTVAQGVRNHFRRVYEAFQRVWSDFQDLPKSAMFKPWAIVQAFSQKRPNFGPFEFIRNRHKQLRKELEIILGGFRRRLREFGAISRTCQNRPCSKPWAIAQAFCSKTAKFRPLRINPKSTQTVPQGVTNHYRRV